MTTSITTPPAFLLARIAEDEAEIAAGFDFASLDSSGWMGHAASWGRERALAECQAKRALIELHTQPHECPWSDEAMSSFAPAEPYFDPDDDRGPEFRWCPVLRLLAVVYEDHPDYDGSWAP